MLWISEFFFCVGTMTITGSVAGGIFLLLKKRFLHMKSGIAIRVLKMVALLYLLPIVYIAVRITRMRSLSGDWINVGYFGSSMLPTMSKILGVVGCIWLAGLIIGIYKERAEYRRHTQMKRHNLPLSDETWQRLADEECEKLHLRKIPVYENWFIYSPLTANIFRPIIIVPRMTATEQQMRMVIEHEINHVRVHDLLWKRIALWVALLHWFNPIAYYLIEWLNLEQEIECDMHVCSTTKYYTPKEYFSYIVSLADVKRNLFFASKLFERQRDNSLFRRIEAMKERRKYGKASKGLVLVLCMALVMVSTVPAYAMAEGIANAEEKMLRDAEVLNADSATQIDASEEICVVETGVINEVEINSGIDTYSTILTMDLTAEPYTRYSWKMQSMDAGQQVNIAIQCSDSDAVYWIGIKNVYTNVATYIQGTGALSHTFTISEDGTYRAFVENRSDGQVQFTGCAIYPN